MRTKPLFLCLFLAAGLSEAGEESEKTAHPVFSPDGSLLYFSDHKGSVRIWDMKANRVRRRISVHDSSIIKLVPSADGTHLAVIANQNIIKVFAAATGERILERKTNAVSVAFVEGTKALAVISPAGKIQQIDLRTGKVLFTSQVSDARRILEADFSPGARRVAVAVDDG